MLLDVLIIILLISALVRGREIGFVQQLFSTVSFFGGLLLGAWLEPHTVRLVHTPLSRSMVTLITTLGMAFILLAVGEYLGARIKHRVQMRWINKIDTNLGAVLSVLSILVIVWLSSAILKTLPFPSVQSEIKQSHIIVSLSQHLPPAPNIIASLGHLVDPNGFPEVFSGAEPAPGTINLPSSSQLTAAVNKDRDSVVKIEGQGCGGIVEGSGFVVGSGLVATNAHVVAGIRQPYVEDANGTHSATAIWFDPNLDFAILRVSNLAGTPLVMTNSHEDKNTPTAVLGYPGGGGFTAQAASILDEFTATGSNIYGTGHTARDVYEVAANIIPGNSGGPLVDTNGGVVGIVFAESTTYNHVGYALQTSAAISALNQASARHQTVNTGSCAE